MSNRPNWRLVFNFDEILFLLNNLYTVTVLDDLE